jgi:hypothetical protein
MKYKILISIVLFALKSPAQELYSTTYFKFNNQEVATVATADFMREIFSSNIEKANYKLIEKYKNGKIKKTAEVLSKHLPILIFEGIVEQYNYNGILTSRETYKYGQVNGPASYYFDNGNVAHQGIYNYTRGDSYFEVKEIYNESGVNALNEKGNGFFELTFKNRYSLKGKFKGGYKEGLWKLENYLTKEKIEENYLKGKFVQGKTIDINGNETIFKDLFTFPYCDGLAHTKSHGEGKMLPVQVSMKSNDLDGKVAYSFDIDQFGNPSNFKLLISLSPNSDKKALEHIKQKKWHPASTRGKTYKTFGYIYVINYNLD